MATEHHDWERACEKIDEVVDQALEVIQADADPLVSRAAAVYRRALRAFAGRRALASPPEDFASVDPHLTGAVDGQDFHPGKVE